MNLLKVISPLPKRWKHTIKSICGLNNPNYIISAFTCSIHGNERLRCILIKEWHLSQVLSQWSTECNIKWQTTIHRSAAQGKIKVSDDDHDRHVLPDSVDFFESLERWRLFLNCVYTEMVNPVPAASNIYGTMEVISSEVCGLVDEMALSLSTPSFNIQNVETAVEYSISCLYYSLFHKLGKDTLCTTNAMNNLNTGMSSAMKKLDAKRGSRLGCEYVTTRHRMYIESVCRNKRLLKSLSLITDDTVSAVSDVCDMYCILCHERHDMRDLSECTILAIDNCPVCLDCTEDKSTVYSLCRNTVMKCNPPSGSSSTDAAILISKLIDTLTE